jgi:hypothetical protein
MTVTERKEGRYRRRKAQPEKQESPFRFDDFSRIASPDNLCKAFKQSRRGVAWKESVQRYEMNLLPNIAETARKLNAGESVTRGFVEFALMERGRIRRIKSVHISERVARKCLCDRILVPVLFRTLIYDNGASLKNKGLHFAARCLVTHLARYYREYKSNRGFCLLAGFSRYFDSTPHDILFRAFEKHLKD